MNRDTDQKYTPQRCAPDDPRRCRANTAVGQCGFKSIPGSQNCPLHSVLTIQREEKATLYNIKRTEVLHRLAHFSDHPDASKLTTELGVLRLTLEELLNRCTDNYEFVAQSSSISQLISQIQSVLVVNTKIQKDLGELLNLQQVLTLAQGLYNIITAYVDDVQVLEFIARDFESFLSGGTKNA